MASSDPVDPLHSLGGVSFFPRTFRASTSASTPADPKDLDSIHQFMKSMTLSSPEKLLDEAKAIVDDGPSLLKTEFAKFVESVGIDRDIVAPEGKQNLQERRPGLGRKRPRFSLKPNARPSACLESSLDIDQLQDPEDFFSAFEKAENAKREIQRQKGGTISDSDNYNQSTNTRGQRRPGILGKSVNYKHRYSSLLSENNNNLMSSQDSLELDLPGSPSYVSQKDKVDTDFEAEETNVAGSVTETDNRLNDILDEILSKNSEEFDGDGALSLFQDKLKIKPIDLSKLSIPVFHDVGRTDFMALGEKLPKTRKTLSNISNLAKRLSGEAHLKQKRAAESPISPTTSPTPPKISVGSISLLKKRSSQPSSLRDPFSPLNVDLSVPRNADSGDDIDEPQIPVLKELSISASMESNVENESGISTTSNVDLQTVIRRASNSLDDRSLDKNLGQENVDVDFHPTGSQSDFTEHGTGDGLIESSACEKETIGEESIDLIIAPDRNTENVVDMGEAAVLSSQFDSHADDSLQIGSDIRVHADQSNKVEGMSLEASIPANSEVNMSQLQIVENPCGDQPPLGDRPDSAATDDNNVVTASITADTITTEPEQPLQPKQKRRAKRPRGESREVKALSRRKSLAEAGTSFESGVRRSRRIKTRPLEYWKGERFLYGRVNESLKLIGLKYVSPGKSEGKLKVKAYVPNDYKEILDLAALH